ncbi:putative transcriptional regulator, PaaX family [Paenibacillus curdlanolyticus YK9]|uniref:Putative transcriptional regulator, PaaX family n=1 Tax=Paenibacillus curdlanolyticus YK9 TaxID=717606 RepID=E0I8N0_9BACL|nr:PaaX family transcriptional regulator C-terminal domain-containing protein [Paenibacillus curdlanolyticus]EFM11535.1 putative transcriptional regulator, PaaX family [Paenibacillus curdlanolyticus YK9]
MISVEKQILYLLSRTAEMSVQELLRIYQRRDYTSQSIRNALFNLKKEGYVDSPTRSYYSILPRGHEFIRSINQKPSFYNKEWDGSWYVLLFEIPEKDRQVRNQLRTQIRQIGFGSLYHSVYVSPWDYTSEVDQLSSKLQMDGRLSLLKGKFVMGDMISERVKEIWPLDEINEVYVAKRQWFRNEFIPSAEPLNTKSDEELFVYFLTLGELIAELSLTDPMLPKQLLPEDWEGDKVFAELQQYLLRLSVHISPSSYYHSFVDHSFF